MNIVEMYINFWKVSYLIKITVDCLKIAFYTSQGSVETVYRWGG